MVLGIATGVVCNYVVKLKRRHATLRGMDQELRQLLRDQRRR